jgi:hypothetical protein
LLTALEAADKGALHVLVVVDPTLSRELPLRLRRRCRQSASLAVIVVESASRDSLCCAFAARAAHGSLYAVDLRECIGFTVNRVIAVIAAGNRIGRLLYGGLGWRGQRLLQPFDSKPES